MFVFFCFFPLLVLNYFFHQKLLIWERKIFGFASENTSHELSPKNFLTNFGAVNAQESELLFQPLIPQIGQPDDLLGYYIFQEESLIHQNPILTNLSLNRYGLLIYKVQKGDTLSSIAKNFGIDVDSIIWANELRSKILYPDQELIILPVSGVLHRVREGDTLEKIAELYSTDITEIKNFNKLTNNPLKLGELLIIPGGKPPTSQLKNEISNNLPSYPNYYILPTTGLNWKILHQNNAVDIANRCGTPVIASAEGLILKTGWTNHYGYYIEIEHPNHTRTLYAHLEKISVKEGDYVLQGQLIGSMGNSGYVQGTTGCHLHFEVHGAKNPFAY